MEFWMRNTYSPVSPEGAGAENQGKLEAATILHLALDGQPAEYRDAVFAPERGTVADDERGMFKKPIDADTYAASEREAQAARERVNPAEYSQEKLKQLILEVAATEKIDYPAEFPGILDERLGRHSEEENQNLWRIFQYVADTLRQHRLKELEALADHDSEGMLATVEGWIEEELQSREAIYAAHHA
jgi:hypothetical protein